MTLVFLDQHIEDLSNPGLGPGKTFAEDAIEHDNELPEFHVIFLGIAIVHEWAKDHIDKEWIGNNRACNLASRDWFCIQGQCVIFRDRFEQLLEVVGLCGEILSYLLDKKVQVVIESEGFLRELNH
ncbi:hypothetical protein ES703_87324 [subsurface metagenome]